MVNFGSWKFWVIVALALGTLACAGRRERREQAREDRRERAEERRERAAEQRIQRSEQRRAQRETQPQPQPAAEQPAERAAPAPTPAPKKAPAVVAVSAPQAAAVMAADASNVVFMRVSKQSSGSDAALFDVTEPGEPKYIGTVGAGSKLSYSFKPGLYTFMVVGETAEFMQASLLGGKTYYALIIPKSGAKRFALEPVRQHELGGKEFATWDRGTKSTNGGAQTLSAAEASDKRVRHWQSDWMKKSESQRAELTLNAEDGR